jgi:signal transduction histidine kinase
MIGQERELAEKRLADERGRVTGQLRQELSSRLERIALQEAAALATQPDRALLSYYENPAVVLVSRVTEGAIVLPWEADSRPQRSRRLMGETSFARRVSQGEHEELVTGNLEQAVLRYRQAIEEAHSPVQNAYAQLLLARGLRRMDREREALTHDRTVLDYPPEVVDERGVPLSLYAATRLLQGGGEHRAVLTSLQRQVDTPVWLSPPALYLLRSLVNTLAESAPDTATAEAAAVLQGTISEYIDRTEQALALQRDFASLRLALPFGPQVNGNDAIWMAYGTPAWLVSLAPSVGPQPAIAVAVRADPIFASLSGAAPTAAAISGEIVLVTEGEQDDESLGPEFPGLVVRFPPGQIPTYDGQWHAQQWFYLITLVLVVSLTLFGAYLLWRDVRREIRLAEMRSNFVSAVSHELKTPLAAIRMFAETLRMGRPAEPEAKNEYLDTIVNESERLTRLLNNVLDFSKIEEGRKSYRREPHDLAEIVQSAIRAMGYPAEQQHFKLHVHTEDGIPPVSVDRDAIEQAILNLLANAMKYSGESRDIDLRLKSADGQATIEVEDRGVGIEVDEQMRIFERFYRIPSSGNQRIPGTGLGLTLVRHIAEGHGGVVTVESTVGGGSLFAIHLPLESGGEE